MYYLEDGPQEKRVIIKLGHPIHSNKKRTILVQYFWPETEMFYTFTASTFLKLMRFSLISKKKFDLSVIRTSSTRTETRDESDGVISTVLNNGKGITKFEASNVPPFTAFKFQWRKISR